MSNRFTTLALITGFALLSVQARADGLAAQGLDDPEVIAPARASGDWTGPYAGLSYGRSKASRDVTTEATETVCTKLGRVYACDDPIFDQFPDYKVETTTTTSTTTRLGLSNDNAGVFAGYRHDFGRIVGGVEVGTIGDITSVEAQLGLDLGRVLPYALIGNARFGDETGTIHGAGVDVKIGKRTLIGIKHQTGDLGDLTSLRVGIQF